MPETEDEADEDAIVTNEELEHQPDYSARCPYCGGECDFISMVNGWECEGPNRNREGCPEGIFLTYREVYPDAPPLPSESKP